MPNRTVSNSISFLKARQGGSAFIVDLDNEMTSVVVDEFEETKAYIELHPLLSAFYGTQNVIGQCTVTVSSSDPDVDAQYNTTTHCIDVEIQAETHLLSKTTITITVVHATYGTRVTTFVIAAIPDGKSAFIQELLPSINEVSFARTSSGGLTPSSRTLSLSIKKTDGNTTSIESVSSSGLAVRWSTSAVPSTSSDGTAWGSGTSVYGITWSSGSMVVANSVSISNIYIAAFNSDGTLVDRETIPVIKDGQNGINAFVVDLENEMTNVALSEDGELVSDFDMYFKVRAYYGTTNVLGDSACSVSASCSDSDVTVTDTLAKTTGIRVQISSGTTLSDTTKVVVTVTHTTYGTRTVIFTLAGVRGGENAVLQELLPSLDNISFARLADGSLTPASRDLSLSFKKTQGGTTTIQTISEAGLTIKWSSSSMPTTSSSGNNWGNGTDTGITWNNITMQISNSVSASNIYIACFNSSGTLVDRETIPIIKDGDNGNDGDDAPAAFATPEQVTIQCNPNGNVVSTQVAEIALSLKVGTHDAHVTSFTYTTPPTGVTVTVPQQYTNVANISVGTTATASGMSSGITFTINGTYDGKMYSASVTVALIGAKKGDQGSRGKVGRFFYYEGEWSDFAPASEFEVSDAQAPYFHYDNNYWVFNPETNGTYTKQDMGTPSSSSSNWQIMTSDFKYLITEAIFTNFAKLASAIFSGDWMLSQYGKPSREISANEKQLVYLFVKVDGQHLVSELATLRTDEELWDEYVGYGYSDDDLESVADVCQWAVEAMPTSTDDVRYAVIQNLGNTSYQYFGLNPSDLFSVFAPNISLDFLQGKAYLNDCKIRGNLVGRTSSPLTRININDWNDYGVEARDDYGYERHYLFMNRMPTWNVQLEHMSGSSDQMRRLILPVITQDTLGTEVIVVNACGYTITVEGKPESSQYSSEGSSLLDGIQTSGYNNDTRTIEMADQTILKFVSVEIPLQFGEYGWIAQGVPQTIKSQS